MAGGVPRAVHGWRTHAHTVSGARTCSITGRISTFGVAGNGGAATQPLNLELWQPSREQWRAVAEEEAHRPLPQEPSTVP